MTKEMRKHLETVIESIIFPNEQAGKAAFHEYCNLKSQAILLGESEDESDKEDKKDEKSDDKEDKKSDKEDKKDEKSDDKEDKKSDKAPPFVKKNKKDEGDEE